MSTHRPPSPTATADPLPLRVAHRIIRADLARLTRLVDDVAGRRQRLDRRRAEALVRYLDLFADSIHHHHTLEDDLLWPVLTAAVGDAIDLGELEEDHGALDPELDRVRAAARHLRESPADEEAAMVLAERLAGLRQLLEEHMTEEDEVVLPAITEHLSAEQWKDIERKAARSGGRLSFELPRVCDAATPEEFAQLVGATNRVLIGLARRLTVPRYRRLESSVFGPVPEPRSSSVS